MILTGTIMMMLSMVSIILQLTLKGIWLHFCVKFAKIDEFLRGLLLQLSETNDQQKKKERLMIKADAEIDQAGPDPNISIFIGDRKIATFVISLLSSDAQSITQLLSNHEGISEFGPESINVSANNLVDQFLIWSILVASPVAGNQPYAVDVTLTQGEQVLGGRVFRHRGTMEISQMVTGRIKFLAA